MWGEPGGHREDDSLWPGAPEHERAPASRVWQKLCQQEDAQGRQILFDRRHEMNGYIIILTLGGLDLLTRAYVVCSY